MGTYDSLRNALREGIGAVIAVTVLALLAVTMPTRADAAVGVECAELAPDEARVIAQEARDAGEHRKAAECFRIAGDLLEADRSLARASVDTGEESARKIAANVDTAKLQARRIRDAFR